MSTPIAELPPAVQIAHLNRDAAKIADLLRALRDTSFSALCPAGRAAVGDALAALNRAEDECSAQWRRLTR